MSDRSNLLRQWLSRLGYRDYDLSPASEDASFRSYLRLRVNGETRIVMDAPPAREPCDQFIRVAEKLRAAGLSAPQIIEKNLEHGFLILTDFGSQDFLSLLDAGTEASLYQDALAALLLMQTRIDASDLPAYDTDLLQREMDLFHDWFLRRLMGIELDSEQRAVWQATRQRLVENALEQPQVFVHRDYHSRNLMKIDQGNPGILDFQDAVRGPITYDLVSLLRDCYFALPPPRVEQLAMEHYESARLEQLLDASVPQFMRWFNLMGIQRHLKAVGIFSRLKIRDGKAGYIADIPRTLEYLRQACVDEESMAGLHSLIEQLQLVTRVAALKTG